MGFLPVHATRVRSPLGAVTREGSTRVREPPVIDSPVSERLDLTELIRRAQKGDARAAEALFAATYPELRRLARSRLRGGGRNTLLDTTSLVHEWYVRFVRTSRVKLEDRAHFMRYAGRAMRTVIVDFARRRRAGRRGGGRPREDLAISAADGASEGADEILRVHDALDELQRLEPRMAKVVELRYFVGLSEAEIAAALDLTERTVRRDWEKARLLLSEALA